MKERWDRLTVWLGVDGIVLGILMFCLFVATVVIVLGECYVD